MGVRISPYRTANAVSRRHSFAGQIAFATAVLFSANQAAAQATPSGGAKPRLELADTVHKAARNEATRSEAAPPRVPVMAAALKPAAAAPAAGRKPSAADKFHSGFVRNQTLLGVGIYAPAFAATVAHDGLAWGASYLLVAGGSFVAAAEISREMTITDPIQRLATGAPIRAAVAGALLGTSVNADRRSTAGAILFASVGATAASLWLGRGMNDGEAAATLFGSDVLGIASFATATAMGLNDGGTSNKTRALITVGGMVAGAPLGQAYAALASYNVTPGDLTAMTASAGVGMLAGFATIANGQRTDPQVAAAMAIGGAAGLFVGDRFLVRRYDHTPAEGRLVVAGGMAGGLMGAGVALLTGGSQGRVNAYTATLTTVGAAGGIILAQRYMLPKADGALRLGGLKLTPLGVVAATSGMRGSYTLGSLSF